MIRKTLNDTQAATFAILLPNEEQGGLPSPMGTGFFVSPDGWFITAAHIITENNESDGPPRDDIPSSFLQKEDRPGMFPGAMCQYTELDLVIPELDFALLKVNFDKNKNKAWLEGRSDFPFIHISVRSLEEAEPVYSFGYPLSYSELVRDGPVKIGSTSLSPRVTSAIISSTIEETQMVSTPHDPKSYVLDRALNYGNSGGPIVSTLTGNAHAFCSRFQPQFMRQVHLEDLDGNPPVIILPSLYGIVISLDNPPIHEVLKERGIPLSED